MNLHGDSKRKGKGMRWVSEKRDTNISTKTLRQEATKVRELLGLAEKYTL